MEEVFSFVRGYYQLSIIFDIQLYDDQYIAVLISQTNYIRQNLSKQKTLVPTIYLIREIKTVLSCPSCLYLGIKAYMANKKPEEGTYSTLTLILSSNIYYLYT